MATPDIGRAKRQRFAIQPARQTGNRGCQFQPGLSSSALIFFRDAQDRRDDGELALANWFCEAC